MVEIQKFQENMTQCVMIDVRTAGFALFSKRKLLATFGGERFAKNNRNNLLSLLPRGIDNKDVVIFEQDDNIIVMLNKNIEKGEVWG